MALLEVGQEIHVWTRISGAVNQVIFGVHWPGWLRDMPCGMTKSAFRRYHNEQEHQMYNVVSKNQHDLLFILSNLAKFSLQIKTPVVLSKTVMHFCEIKSPGEVPRLSTPFWPVGPCSQKMAPLPPGRVSLSPAFTHVGIDFAGPLFIRGSDSSAKAYICIFTCACSRMTHLELTVDLSTNEFFQAFIRMISRRGLCSTIWSDNAKTFKRADREI